MDGRSFVLGIILGAVFVAAIGWMGYVERTEELRVAKELYLDAEKKAKSAEELYDIERRHLKIMELAK